jgi:tRNA modification GTPase
VYHIDDTIAAIASSPTGAARGIVRVSGPDVAAILRTCFPAAGEALLSASRPTVAGDTIAIGASARLAADVYFWPGVGSYTRQTTAEIHTVGSPALLPAVLRAVCAAGARPAGPGEFTLRAFLAGRLDLTQAEAVLGVIDAQSDDRLRQAQQQLAGGLSRPLAEVRESLLDLLAHLEAGLDFVEEDIQFVTREQLAARLEEAAAAIGRTSAQLSTRQRSDAPPRVALVGWPNVGKSSLFNALVADRAALVSDVPGTTRDYLSARVDLGGCGCELIDTAGRQTAETVVEHAAQQLAAAQAASCDVECLCLDASRPLNDWEQEQLSASAVRPRLVVWTKCDRAHRGAAAADVATSAVTGQGLSALRGALRRLIAESVPGDATAERCADSLLRAGEALARARDLVAASQGEELVAAELRVALGEVGKVVGAVYTDDILDRVFSRFCIGK